jgi:hypothetical protein
MNKNIQALIRNIIKTSNLVGLAIGLLILFAQCGQDHSQWDRISLTINGENTWVQGVNFLGEPTPETTYYLEEENLTLQIIGNTFDNNSLIWRLNNKVHPVLGSEKYLSRADLTEGSINVIAICLGDKGPCKSIFISVKTQNVLVQDFEDWADELEMDEATVPEPRPANTGKTAESIKTNEKSSKSKQANTSPLDVEREYKQVGRAGFNEKQRCPNGDQYTYARALKITLVPLTHLELKSFKLFATDNGKIDVLIQGEGGEKWRINGRAMVGGSASEINLESLTCELQPNIRYTITVNADPNIEFENIQACHSWPGGNEHLKLIDAGQGGAFFDIRYKY